ncbi:MAG: succinate dehydrogenase/fumarate reductase cytochrome b subunit [Proteiniphilum sp.]|nr:succinate dehydrogenase/fumarate reductase cytochrome b subunit [Proteiniphilum sp.]
MSWLINSSIGRKMIMSISGLFLVLFLLFHSLMNVVVLISAEGYDAIVGFLGANWYALIATVVLASGFIIHIIYAVILTLQNMKARGPSRYAVSKPQRTVSWASKNMFVLGVIILGFLLLHLFHFWYKMQLVEVMHIIGVEFGNISEATKGVLLIEQLFKNPIYCVIYLAWLVAIWFHLTHGFWSAMHTLGWSNQVWLPRLKKLSYVLATIICLLFAAIPVAYLLGFTNAAYLGL